MRKMHWFLTLPLTLCGVGLAADAPESRSAKMEALLQVAVDRFQLNRYVEARAALERLLAEDPTDLEAFDLRNLFGERILLEMQRFGVRTGLDDGERRALQLLGEAGYALDRNNPQQAQQRLKMVIDVLKEAGYAADDFSVKRANELIAELNAASNAKEYAAITEKITSWRERLQSVGNAPLVLLSRAQRYEQQQMREPERMRTIINNALSGGSVAQQSLLDVARLGAYAVPELLNNLRDERSETRRTNAHFVLLTMGADVMLPLCEALKTDNQLLVQRICLLLGDIRPADKRAVPYLKSIYDNKAQLSSARSAAGDALRSITGQDPEKLLPAADYFLLEANRYYRGGADVDNELTAAQNTLWVWDPETDDGKGGLRELAAPRFVLGDLIAEELTYRGLKIATDKTPFQVLLASVFLQEKSRVDTMAQLLVNDDLSHPDTLTLRRDTDVWKKRFNDNQRVVYTLGIEHLTGVLEKALVDNKTEVAIGALDALAAVAGKTGWLQIENYKTTAGVVGSGASGDGAVADFIDTGSAGMDKLPDAKISVVVPVHNGASRNYSRQSNPLVAALDNPNPRIAIAAAAALVNLGLPKAHPAYAKLLPLLMQGVQENRATVVEVITADQSLRQKLTGEIDRSRMLPLAAADGYTGYQLAIQYPPKDVILLDNRVDQFNTLRLQIELRGLTQERLLPLTIVTTREHVGNIVEQFKNTTGWRTKVYENILAAQVDAVGKSNLFDDLQAYMKQDPQTRSVAIITQPSREERYKIKEALALRAERSLRPSTLTEYSSLRNKEKVLGDIFGVRVTYVPVFVDEEIGGYDAMRTVQALQIDPRTRLVPIAVLVGNADLANVKADFERFIKDGVVEVINRNIDTRSLNEKIGELKSKNPLAEKHYARALSNEIAVRSADALAKMDGTQLSAEQERQLFAVVSDVVGRPEYLRIAAANALGHFHVQSQLQALMTLYTDTDQRQVALCAALIKAIGEIDSDNKFLDFKLNAFRDAKSPEVQKAVAVALGPAAQNQAQMEKYMENLRINDPLMLVRAGTETASPETTAASPISNDVVDSDNEEFLDDEGEEENW